MDKLKQWVALSVVAALGILAGGWFLLVGPKRSEAAELRAQADQAVTSNAQLQTQLQVLKAQAKDLPQEQAELAAVAAKIPGDPSLPALVRSLLDAATSTGVELVSITPSAPVLVAPAEPVKPTAPAPASGQAGPAAPTAPAAGGAAAAAATPAAGPAGTLANIPVKLEVHGDFFEIQQFVSALEELSRAVRVTGLTVAPGESPTQQEPAEDVDGRSLLGTIDGLVFMAAQRPPAVTATVPGAEGAPADAAATAAAAPTTPAG